MFQVSISKLTSLLLSVFCILFVVNVRATCVGYDYEQQIPTVQTEIPTVDIINNVLVINPNDSITLQAEATVDSANDGKAFYFWCAEKGTLECEPTVSDCSKVKYTASFVSEYTETVELFVQVGDGLGYVNDDTTFLQVMSPSNNGTTLEGYISNKFDKPVPNLQIEVAGRKTITDENGFYQLSGLVSNTYRLTPKKDGYNFTPIEITIGEDDPTVVDISVVTPSPASCQLYAVNDKGLNNSQIFFISFDDFKVTELGPLYQGYDLEAIGIDPRTGIIYLASGDNVTNGNKGHLYIVDGQTGELFPVGSTGFKEIEDLAFSPDGTLYAWAKDDGLITIDLINGNGTLVLDSDIPIEGLTLDKNQANLFYGAVSTDLWQYDMEANTLDVICPNGLLGETEALEITLDGLLLVGTHKVPFSLHAFDAQTCQVIEADKTLSNQYNDVEGIAVPVAACIK